MLYEIKNAGNGLTKFRNFFLLSESALVIVETATRTNESNDAAFANLQCQGENLLPEVMCQLVEADHLHPRFLEPGGSDLDGVLVHVPGHHA